MEENPFLLFGSTIFDGANMIDYIRQSYIDLDETTDGELVEILLENSIKYLNEKELTYDVANELIAIIPRCFQYLQSDPMPFLNSLFEKSKTNSYYIVTFASVLSYLINNKKDLDLSNYHSFVVDALKEIQPQFKNQDNLILFNHEIPFQFRADLIFDLLLSLEKTDDLVNEFEPFYSSNKIIINHKSFSNFVTKFSKNDLKDKLIASSLSNDLNTDESADANIEKISSDFGDKSTDKTDLDDLFSEIFKIEEPEKDNSINEKIFQTMLNEKQNALGYLQSTFENLKKISIQPKELMELFSDEYQTYKSDFIQILSNVYVLHPEANIFVPQPRYKPLDLPDLEYNEKIISKLFNIVSKDPSNYQAYYCLECIANSFPFIFDSNIDRFMESILPALNNFKLIYENEVKNPEQENQRVKKGKAAILALNSLLFTLNSTKAMDSFIAWFFGNHEKLTLSQLFTMILVFIIISEAKHVSNLTASFLKYHIFDEFNEILFRKIPNSLFGKNFNIYLYILLYILHILDTELTTVEILSIKENLKKDSIFYEASKKHITHTVDYVHIFHANLIKADQSEMSNLSSKLLEYIENYEKIKPSYIKERTINTEKSEELVSIFLDQYNNIFPDKPTTAEEFAVNIPNDITISQFRTFIGKENWIIEYTLLGNRFPILSEHSEILSDVMNAMMIQNENIKDEEGKMLLDEFDASKYLSFICENDTFVHNILSRITTTFYVPSIVLSDYIMNIPYNLSTYKIILSTIKDNFTTIIEKIPYYELSIFNANLQILTEYCNKKLKLKIVDKSEFINIFFEILGDYLINIILMPQYRQYNIILEKTYQLFRNFGKSIRILHIIGFMIRSDDVTIQQEASKLCCKFDDAQTSKLSILGTILRKEISSEKPQISIISNILLSGPSFGAVVSEELCELLDSSLEKCEKVQNKNNEEEEEEDTVVKKNAELKDFIIQLLDFLSPDRDEKRTFALSDSMFAKNMQQDDQFRFCPIPQYVYSKAPTFWDVFEKHRSYINEILLKKIKSNDILENPNVMILSLLFGLPIFQFSSKFVSNYPECFSYDFRSTFFRQLISDDLDRSNDITLEIHLDNIYTESFEKLHDKSPDEWKKNFKIIYIDNIGEDAGGLTKDFFTKITAEIFNPKSEIFEASESNQNYSPKGSKTAETPENLEKFKFAGMIIARALMKGILVPAHLTKAFLKQILHRDYKIKYEDLEDADEVAFNSLEYYKKLDFDSHPEMDIRFEIDDNDGNTIELKENGSQIRVNSQNLNEYIDLTTEYRLKTLVQKQVQAFCEGFDSLIPHEKIRMFTPTELCLLICGVPKIDVDDLRNNVVYEDPYNEETPVVKLFFETIKEWDDEYLAKLLYFITGTTRMPASGFAHYRQISKPITIRKLNESDSYLPIAHVCTNTIELPEYQTKEEMNSKLMIAVYVKDFQIK